MNSFLVSAVTFFINHDKDKKDVITAFRAYLGEDDYRQVRSDLFECFLQLPQNSLYLSKYVHILHSVCEEIVTEDIPLVPSCHLVHQEEAELGKELAPISKYRGQDVDRLKTWPEEPAVNEGQMLPLLLRFE